MPDPRQTRTNAADSAPGVDDGRAGAGRFRASRATPGGGVVWVLVALTLLALIAIFVLRPISNREAAPSPPQATTAPAEAPQPAAT